MGVNLLQSAKWYQRETGVTRKSCLLSSGLCTAERGESLQVSWENFESSFLISLPKSLAKYAESNSTDHRLIWSGSLELHKQTMHYSWANWAFALLQQTGTSRNVLASFTWLTGPLGRPFAEQSGEQRRLLIQLGWFALWLRSSSGKPIWIHLQLVSAVFVRQLSMGIRNLGFRKMLQEGKTAWVPVYLCARPMDSSTYHPCSSCTHLQKTQITVILIRSCWMWPPSVHFGIIVL